ncbi:GNAT family N-acetyltransferase [Glycomyces paridis]|uniref:GNAT family N-acetyltransferase n=1 Tax=Glycomyces paridis TaxID=2126555 RepID=A0A4S8PJM0_9ACTN|nr:GNAT family N-acetyltransferase [Glycomyces paridis]THV30893.1 GNAT family N-acetyltransferase [Glycomyces paridis]
MTLRVAKTGGRWEARSAGALAGRAHCWTRPDGKRFADFVSEDAAVIAALSAAVTEDGRALHTTADVADADALRRLAEAGFVGERYEHRWTVPVTVAADWDDAALAPFEVRSPEDSDASALRVLDDELRADIPGLRGWRWSREAWEAEHASPAYDPALYPVLRDGQRFAGMARVWSNPGGPRLGLVAVTRPYRRRGLGAALLARLFRELRERGETEVATECDAANTASHALLAKAGGRIVGGEVELVARPA